MKSIALFTLILVLSLSSFCQSKDELIRKGFVFGASFGVSNSMLHFPSQKQNNTGQAINWKAGYVLNPRMVLLINGAVSIYEYNLTNRKRHRDFGGVFASAQYFFTDRIWALAGVGIGTDAPVFYDVKPENTVETKYYTGFGAISSIGYEFYHKRNFAFDVQARVNYSNVNLSIGKTSGVTLALLLGFNFY